MILFVISKLIPKTKKEKFKRISRQSSLQRANNHKLSAFFSKEANNEPFIILALIR